MYLKRINRKMYRFSANIAYKHLAKFISKNVPQLCEDFNISEPFYAKTNIIRLWFRLDCGL